MGNLIFHSVPIVITDTNSSNPYPIYVSSTNPRDIVTQTLRIGFDNAYGITQTPSTLTNPVFIVSFPSVYTLSLFSDIITATVTEYIYMPPSSIIDSTSILSSQATYVLGKTYSPLTSVSGNKVYLTFSQSSITIPQNFLFYEIVLNNIHNPIDEGNTGLFEVKITNENLTYLYRTYTNLNNFWEQPGSDDTIQDDFMPYNGGNTLTFDNNRWVIDVYSVSDTENQASINSISINAGAFYQYQFIVADNPNFIEGASVLISLSQTGNNDNEMFTMIPPQIELNSSDGFVYFWIGVVCGTPRGKYVISFVASDPNFYQINPIIVNVDITPSVLNLDVPTESIPQGTDVKLLITLSQPNVDAIDIDYTTTSNSVPVSPYVIYKASALTAGRQLYTTISIDPNSTTTQTFSVRLSNTCYTLNSMQTFQITVGGAVPTLSNVNLADFIKVPTSTTRRLSTVSSNLNSIQLTFNSPTAPLDLYCALFCSSMTPPSTAQIIQGGPNTPLLQFYSNEFLQNNTNTNIEFDNLVRGQSYTLNCIASTTQTNVNLRTTSIFSITSIGNNTLATPPTLTTQCAQFSFYQTNFALTDRIKSLLVNYCQNQFSGSGGCVVCMDPTMTYINHGLALTPNLICPVASKTKLRFLQSNTTNQTNSNNTTNTTVTPTILNLTYFSTCAVPDLLCPTDSANYNTTINTNIINNLKMKTIFANFFGTPAANALYDIQSVIDDTVPDLNSLNFSNLTYSINGQMSFALGYKLQKTIQCSWAVTTSTPTIQDLQICNNTVLCGIAIVSPTPFVVNLQPQDPSPLQYNTNYNLYVGCYNYVPLSTKVTGVKSFASFTIVKPVIPGQCLNKSLIYPNCTASGSYMNMSLMVIFLLFAILFN
jgi:hypothetical protein